MTYLLIVDTTKIEFWTNIMKLTRINKLVWIEYYVENNSVKYEFKKKNSFYLYKLIISLILEYNII